MTYQTSPAKSFSSLVEILALERRPSRYVSGSYSRADYETWLIERQHLLSHNAKVYLAARSAQKANEAIAELKNETGKQAIFLQLDLSDIPCSPQVGARVPLERESTACPYQQCWCDDVAKRAGHRTEWSWWTDRRCPGHWLLTELLLPALFAATDASPSHEKARVV
ncbi:hypothetical protein EDB87DRAFT_1654800, partial [Lactarius vividus]